jgi:hypothetical protein
MGGIIEGKIVLSKIVLGKIVLGKIVAWGFVVDFGGYYLPLFGCK